MTAPPGGALAACIVATANCHDEFFGALYAVARPHNNKLSGLIDAAEHELMPPTPKVDTEPRKEPCASRSQRA